MHIQPYLNFDGRTEEAVEFYKKAAGAEVQMLMRFSDSPVPVDPNMVAPANAQKIMHAAWKIGDSLLMGADCACQGKANFQGVSLTLNVANEAEAQRLFNALADGGKIQQPLIKTFFSSSWGILQDRFGVPWMIMAATQ